MDLWKEWLFLILASSAGAAALIAISAYLGRSQLSHWLSKDLEAQKAAHQRDLDSYKVSLIAEAERAKASQDVRKAMAIRIAEKKFSAIDEVHRKISSQAISVLSALRVHSGADYQLRRKTAIDLLNKAHEASTSVTFAEPFLKVEEISAIHIFLGTLSDVIGRMDAPDFRIAEDEFENLKRDLIGKQQECDLILNAQISKMLSMD